ncbi:MAG TPA: TIM barrel protein [Bacteroidales bacterium]|jgi:sugar phosphate isomerase/epimerase|nr:TIM barrel protein [Bacteroidales bacterium]
MKKHKAIYMMIILISVLFVPFACKKTAAPEKNIGLQLYSLRDSMAVNPVKTIEEVGKIGYKTVELAGYNDGRFYGMTPAEIKDVVEKNGMIIISSHTGQAVPDSIRWDSVMAWWDACIDAHAQAGVKYIVQPWMDSIGYQSLAGLKRYCDYFNAVGEKCLAKGLRFGYHNHSEEFKEVENQVIYDYMLQNTDSTKVFFQMDLYWIKEGGADAVEYFTNYPGRFVSFHVKDTLEVGASGEMDFEAIFNNADLAGMKYYIVEQEEYTTTPIEGVKQSYEFMKNAEYVK